MATRLLWKTILDSPNASSEEERNGYAGKPSTDLREMLTLSRRVISEPTCEYIMVGAVLPSSDSEDDREEPLSE